MKHLLLLVAAASAAAGLGALGWASQRHEPPTAAPMSGTSQFARDDLDRALNVKEGTRTFLGVFERSRGRKAQLLTADTLDGRSCLIDERENGAVGASCLEDGLFARQKVAFLTSFEGGPEHFTELDVSGVAAPGIRAVALVKTDGTVVQLRMSANQAFLYESPAADLDGRIYPAGLRLYGPRGRVVETVALLPPG